MGERLRPKYIVYRKDDHGLATGEAMQSTDPEDIDSPFVLMPRKDHAAYLALIVYAKYCEPDLRAELALWLGKIADAGPKLGTQGMRNFQYEMGMQLEMGL